MRHKLQVQLIENLRLRRRWKHFAGNLVDEVGEQAQNGVHVARSLEDQKHHGAGHDGRNAERNQQHGPNEPPAKEHHVEGQGDGQTDPHLQRQ